MKLALSILPILFCITPGARAQAKCAQGELPQAVISLVARKFPGWRVAQLGDLMADDQDTWTSAQGNVCPGFAAGNFDGSGKKSYAIVISRKRDKYYSEALVVTTQGGDSFPLTVLSKQGQSVRLSVVSTVRPGTYESFTKERNLLVRYDGILYETLEAGAETYYWSGGKFLKVQRQIKMTAARRRR